MKKLILSICLIVFSIGVFASSSVVSKETKSVAIKMLLVEKSKENVATKLNNLRDCIGVTLSCGVSYDICNFSGTTEQLLNSVLNANNNVCGTNFKMFEIAP